VWNSFVICQHFILSSGNLVQLQRRPICFTILLIMPIKKSLLIAWESHTTVFGWVTEENEPALPPCYEELVWVLRICVFWIEHSVNYLLTQILISWCNNYWLCCRDMPVLLIWKLNAKWLEVLIDFCLTRLNY